MSTGAITARPCLRALLRRRRRSKPNLDSRLRRGVLLTGAYHGFMSVIMSATPQMAYYQSPRRRIAADLASGS